jgi:maltooligosyltrehalose trehalohydrolase
MMLEHAAGKNLYDVWAPNADSVRLLADGHEYAMERLHDGAGAGWWRAPADVLTREDDGVRYGYIVDGEGPFPDPRSRRQPDGVHELSATFDPSAHEWKDSEWRGRSLKGSVIYELHLGTFTPEGTLDAAAAKLDYLVDLGVDFIELLPVNGSTVSTTGVTTAFFGMPCTSRMVAPPHISDLWMRRMLRAWASSRTLSTTTSGQAVTTCLSFGPYLKSGEGNTWGDSVNLDGPGSDDVRRYILENAAMWLRDYHVDGLRLDAVHALRDERAVHILEEFGALGDEVEAAGGVPRTLIAESDLNNPRLIYPRQDNGYGLEGQWSDDFHHAVHVNVSGETTGYYADFDSLAVLAKVLEHGFLHDGSYSSFRGGITAGPYATTSRTPPRLWSACRTTTKLETGPPAIASPHRCHTESWPSVPC